jgi:diguanylate cyclase (GGDEF)-like protein
VQAQQTAERLRQQVASLSPSSLSTAITISIGVSKNQDNDDVAALVQRADAAMYAAKERGRNRVAVSGSSDPKVV